MFATLSTKACTPQQAKTISASISQPYPCTRSPLLPEIEKQTIDTKANMMPIRLMNATFSFKIAADMITVTIGASEIIGKMM